MSERRGRATLAVTAIICLAAGGGVGYTLRPEPPEPPPPVIVEQAPASDVSEAIVTVRPSDSGLGTRWDQPLWDVSWRYGIDHANVTVVGEVVFPGLRIDLPPLASLQAECPSPEPPGCVVVAVEWGGMEQHTVCGDRWEWVADGVALRLEETR